jgi:hypothetical protein
MAVPFRTGSRDNNMFQPHGMPNLNNPKLYDLPQMEFLGQVPHYNNNRVRQSTYVPKHLYAPPPPSVGSIKDRSILPSYVGSVPEPDPDQLKQPRPRDMSYEAAKANVDFIADSVYKFVPPDFDTLGYTDKDDNVQAYIQALADESMRAKVEELQRKGYSQDEIMRALQKKRESDIQEAMKKPTSINTLMSAQLARTADLSAIVHTGRHSPITPWCYYWNT